MVLSNAISAIIALLKGCALPSEKDFTQHTFYSTVKFRPEYPRGTLDVPVVAVCIAGGINTAKGLGKVERWRQPRLQLDILAADSQAARRIYEKVIEVVLYDQNNGAGAGDGTFGSMYLYGQGLTTVVIGEARSAVWDTEGRISRLVADVEVSFSD